MTQLSHTDQHALGRSFQAYRRISARNAAEVSEMRNETAKYCAVRLQQHEQGLSYEELAPGELGDVTMPAEPDSVTVAMVTLLHRLQRNGLSRYKPFPERACEAAEQRRRETDSSREEPSSAA